MPNYVVSRNQLLVATNLTMLVVELDPIPTGDATNGRAILNVLSLTAPPGNTVELRVFMDTSNDGLVWLPSGTALYTATATGIVGIDLIPTAEWFRFRYVFVPNATGTDVGTAVVLFDLKVRTYKA